MEGTEEVCPATTQVSDFVAVTDDDGTAGATIWWALSGTLHHQSVIDEWEAANLPPEWAPNPPAKGAALKRALMTMATRRTLVRPLGKRGAYALVVESVQDLEIDHETTFKVTLEEGEETWEIKVSPENEPLLQRIETEFYYYLQAMDTTDVSWWLTGLAKQLQAVSLRPRGGIYFLPRTKLELWRRIVGIIRKVSPSVEVFEMPTLSCDEAVRAVLSALTKEAEEAISGYEEDLIEEDLGARALGNRVEKCKEMQQKLKTYEILLGGSMGTIAERLVELEGQLAAASLLAMSTGEEE